MLVDFEQAAINASESVFWSCSVKGCFFELSHCVYRRVQEEGLQGLYTNDNEINLHTRMIAAIAIVPLTEVEQVFETLSTCVRQELQPVMDYFEDNFTEDDASLGFRLSCGIIMKRRSERGLRPLTPQKLGTAFFRSTYNAVTPTSGGSLRFCTEKTRCSSIAWDMCRCGCGTNLPKST